MARGKDYQFDYPDKPWSEGKMRMAKAGPRGDPGKEYRELEGIRKRKEQILSQGGGQQFAQMSSAIPGEANIGAAAGAMSDNKVIGAMENILKGQQAAQGIEGLTAADKKKRGVHPDDLSDDQLLQQYQRGFQEGKPVVLHGSRREMELYMRALGGNDTAGGG